MAKNEVEEDFLGELEAEEGGSIEEQVLDQAALFHQAFFESPSGVIVLEILRNAFCGNPYVVGDTHETARRCGNMEVVNFIEHQIQIAKSGGK